MTEIGKKLHPWLIDTTLDDYIDEKTKEISRLCKLALNNKQIELDEYQELIIEMPEPKTIEQAFDYFTQHYTKLEFFILSKKIIKGAEYIEHIGKDHKNYEKAIKRYDELVKQLQEIN